MENNIYHNKEGYPDPTAGNAMANMIHAQKKENSDPLECKKKFLIKVLKFIISEAGFELIGRIQIKDSESGREFR